MLSGHAHRVATQGRSVSWPWAELAVVAAQALLFVPFAALRFVDGDEGAYLLAGKLAMQGEVIYRDFLHTQMPLVPYVYGAWSLAVGEGWLAARLLSVAFAVALGLLLYRHAAGRFGRGLALAGVALYLTSSLVFAWFTTVKTQVLSTLLLFGAFAVVERAGAVDVRRWVAGGVLVGLAVDTRLIFAATLPAFAWAAYRSGEKRRRPLAGLAGGTALGLTPSLVFLAIDARRFVFDNLGYHAERSSGGLVGDFRQKAEAAANLLGIGTPDGGQTQFLLLVLAAGLAAVSLRILSGRIPLALLIAGWLALGSFLPTPTYPQYFSTTVPFLIVGALEAAATLRSRPAVGADLLLRRVAAGAVAAVILVYAGLATVDLYRYLVRHPDQRIGRVEQVAEMVDEQTRPGEQVLASWPGYLYGSHAAPVPGMENDFAPHEAGALSLSEARDYRLATAGDVERMIRERRVRLVVFRLWHVLPPVPDWEGALADGRYRLLADIDSSRVYVRSGG
jgi:4-amino-4-deoxy-L-arabinose transferase-like glycosyltransferase